MIQLNNLSKGFGAQTLFENANLVINSKERVGLVGRNGSGKSTLFKIIAGSEHSDSGNVSIPKNYTIGVLSQHIKFEKENLWDEVSRLLKNGPELEGYLAEKILFGLGFTEEDLVKNPESFSGGYQVRIELAKVLVTEPNLLLLDEPTNYLDIISLRWLQRFLTQYDGEVILISHDREFVDSICTHIMGIHRGNIRKIKGVTTKYYEQIYLDEEVYEQTRVNQEKKKKELKLFIDRFRAKASKATQAQSKIKQLEKMEDLEKLDDIASMGFSFHYTDCPGKYPLSVVDLSFGFSDEDLFSNLSFDVGKKDRIGIIGKNGKGKSTLLNVISANLKQREGTINWHPHAKFGYFGQTNIERLHSDNSIVQEINAENEALSQTEARRICGSMMFPGEYADKKISVLSGGEKSRVMLGKIIAKPANILFLDEPTNHLDMESIEILCDEIDKFPGALLIVTHSEMLLKCLVNKLIIFRREGAQFFHGGYEDFLEKIGWEEEDKVPKVKKSVEKKVAPKKEVKQSNNIKIEEVEAEIVKLEELLEKYNELMIKKAENGENIHELSVTVEKINQKIEEKFQELEKFQ
jgi:ATP-binding cassette subfamily F protein 3